MIGTRSPAPAAPAATTLEESARGLLLARDLHRSWGELRVLDRLDLSVERGTLVGISGANGSGKTTLLRICAGLIRAERGTLALNGLDPQRDRAAYQSRVGFLAAGDRGLYARLTAMQHLELWGRISLLGRDRFRAAIERTVDLLALGELAERRMDRLSMGQRQRVRLAMAFLHEPDLVLLDEPLNSLDQRAGELLLGCLSELTGRGGAAIWCSPTIAEEAPFDRRLVLERRRLWTAAR